MRKDLNRAQTIGGIAVVGAATTGILSLIIALFPLIRGDYLAAGVCLLAAAFSFGLLANAVFRD